MRPALTEPIAYKNRVESYGCGGNAVESYLSAGLE